MTCSWDYYRPIPLYFVSIVIYVSLERIPMVNLAAAFATEGISAFRFDFAGNGESEGSFQYGNYYREVDDLRAVIQYFEHEKRSVAAIIGHSKASRFNDVHNVVNISGRFDLKRGIEDRLGKDYLQRIKKYGFIDVGNRKGNASTSIFQNLLLIINALIMIY
ncbi:putative alpha/Beta hydrolase [Helianthus annuus]|nr:putative alpha/Beta hydrolase [Helianthus annuus]